ncbi:hypothetical protein MCNS_04650 [Mycobacterium conspicuum]|uniref:Uncharacterized protein n=1 Tax=Mycobacterium conspicuum TaxID=44010 RepID=A0A7I7Y8M5_9MYCO|nr:hypothetical protein MCNS_04650 [Mycobacterium conspicuum]
MHGLGSLLSRGGQAPVLDLVEPLPVLARLTNNYSAAAQRRLSADQLVHGMNRASPNRGKRRTGGLASRTTAVTQQPCASRAAEALRDAVVSTPD